MWWNDYIGLPWCEGGRDNGEYDCWGLVRDILLTHGGIELPRLDHVAYSHGGDQRQLIKAIKEYNESIVKDEWNQLTFDEKKCMFDILWLRNGGPIHFAVMIDDKRFIHIEEGCNAVVESVDSMRWKNKVRGIYRHKSKI